MKVSAESGLFLKVHKDVLGFKMEERVRVEPRHKIWRLDFCRKFCQIGVKLVPLANHLDTNIQNNITF